MADALLTAMVDIDPMMRVCDDEDADRWINKVFNEATDAEVLAMARAFLGLPGDRPAIIDDTYGDMMDFEDTKVGGAAAGNLDDIDIRVFRLLELRDSLHDFPSNAEEVAHAVGLDEESLPIARSAAGQRRMTFASMSLDRKFMNDMTAEDAELIFPGDNTPVRSPLAGMDYRPLVFKYPDFTGIKTYATTLWDAYGGPRAAAYDGIDGAPPGAVFHTCQVFALPGAGRQVLEMTQICEVCHMLRARFSDTACFMMDANEPIASLFIAYQIMADRLAVKFKIRYAVDRAGTSAYTAEAADIVRLMSAVSPATFTAVQCAASMLDGADHQGIVDSRVTPTPSHRLSSVRVSFGPCTGPASYSYAAHSAMQDAYRRGVQEMNVEKRVIDGIWTYGPGDRDRLPEMYSINTVTTVLDAATSPVGTRARWSALKRAGDWGQVEHCKRYGMVLVTTDKPTFMHAVMRDACAWLIEIKPAYKGAGYMLYSFVTYTSTGARARLCRQSDIPGQVRPQTGGALTAVNAVAIATLLISALLGGITSV